MIFIPIVLLLVIAGFAYSGMWVMYFYYDTSFFKTLKNQDFWNPGAPNFSYLNKYKNRDRNQGPAFFGSETFFVGFTDGFHMLQEIALWSIFISIGLICYVAGFAEAVGHPASYEWMTIIVVPVGAKLLFGLGFWLGFDKEFNKK